MLIRKAPAVSIDESHVIDILMDVQYSLQTIFHITKTWSTYSGGREVLLALI